MTRDSKPLVSIVTPSYNQGKFIEDTILSIKNQDYPNIEHIIIDGGSTNNTLDILKKYEGVYNMHWISEEDKGQADAINKGLKLAKGDIIGWLNSDDLYATRDVITKVVKYFSRFPQYGVIYGDLLQINAENRIVKVEHSFPFFNYKLLTSFNYIPQPATFFRREIINQHKLDNTLQYSMDYEFWLRLGHCYKVRHINEILACFRHHSLSKTLSQPHKMAKEGAQVREKYNLPSKGRKSRYLLEKVIRRLLLIIGLGETMVLYHKKDKLMNHLVLPSRAEIILNQCFLGRLAVRKLRNK